jgi:hypothetical protein
MISPVGKTCEIDLMTASMTVKVRTAQLAKTRPSTAPPAGDFGVPDPDPPALRDRGLVVVAV